MNIYLSAWQLGTVALEIARAYKALSKHGCDHYNAESVATTVTHA